MMLFNPGFFLLYINMFLDSCILHSAARQLLVQEFRKILSQHLYQPRKLYYIIVQIVNFDCSFIFFLSFFMLQGNCTFLIQVHCLQNALFGMDIPAYDNGRKTGEFSILDDLNSEDISFDDDYLEVSKDNHAFQKKYDNLPFIEIG